MESQTEQTSQTEGRVHVVEQNGIFTVFLGAETERVITFTSARMGSLKEAVKEIAEKKPKGVIFIGPHLKMFAAGADINAISDVTDPVVGEELGIEGQATYQLIEDLPCVTVAAISGPCVGGGCELALACNYRIISDDPSSQIGLPETKLGIIPGWGGTQRLPRLIGIRKALGVILPGKNLRGTQAKKTSIVHEIVSGDDLHKRALEIASKKATPAPIPISLMDRFLTFTAIGRYFAKSQAEKSLEKETKGNYPAPPAALKAILLGLGRGTKIGYPHEASELGRLITTPESKALVNLFFLTEGAKRLGKGGRKELAEIRTAVIGAGIMGAGIAGALVQKKFPVVLKDTSQKALDRGKQQVSESLEKKKYLSAQERSDILALLECTSDEEASFSETNYIIEAIIENLEIKKKVLGAIADQIPEEGIIATNTSSLSVSEISEGIKNPGRVVGMHFFNPVEKMPLVEIVRGKDTDDNTVMVVAALTTKLGKFPIVVSDVPGFLVNRILTPYLNESGYLLLEGYQMNDIDRAATKFGMPMGPIRLLDEVGLDVAKHVSQIMVDGYGERMRSNKLVDKLIDKKFLGKKSGAGFYLYDGGKPLHHQEAVDILAIEKKREMGDAKIVTDRLIMSLINEAVRCLDEGVAGTPGKDAANQIDLGTVMGTGFPPFRGGLIAYAQSIGAKEILSTLKHLEKQCGERFTPWSGIVQRAEQNKSFYEAIAVH